jgi:DNA-binding transcriptional LysR family regulator
VIVGAADYFNRRGVPSTPKELLLHDGICFSFGRSGQIAPWLFSGEQGQYSVMPKTKVIVNDVPAMLNYAQSGIGLAYVYKFMVTDLIDNGSLQTVLPNQLVDMPRYTINYLSKRNMPVRLRAFIDFVKQSV